MVRVPLTACLLTLLVLSAVMLQPVRAQVTPCARLKNVTLTAAQIGLPTRGARVRSAKVESSGGVRFCKVRGEITSVSPAAQNIRFELNLPDGWNGKAVHFGGGGFDGSLNVADGLRTPEVGIKRDPTPLERHFATFGSDSGHHHDYLFLPDEYNELKGRFALNDEERRNFAHDALKKVHDTAVALIVDYYGSAPKRMFFLGGSTGGREAYFVTQLWPADYDGVLGAYAGWNQVELDLQFIRVAQAEYRKGSRQTRGWLPRAKTELVARRVMDACDAADGLHDGIISNPAGCHFDLNTLACPAGKNGRAGEDASDCLTPGQLQTFQVFDTQQRTSMPLYHAVQSIPGYNITRGTDLTGSMGLLSHPFHDPAYPFGSFYYQIGSSVLRFFLTKDPSYNMFEFNTTTGGTYADQLLPQSIASDASDADLTPFARHGGKFLMLHGTSDATIPTGSSIEFYQMMQAKMGQAAMDAFMRFYLIPGFGHGRGTFDAGFDALGVLDRWLDGQPPAGLVVTDNNKLTAGRTRPLCVYPEWPKYTNGDPNKAQSFTCVQ
jgi:hypothetical protein